MSPKKPTGNSKIIFLEHNPFMSVELLDLLDNYKIICYNDDPTYALLKERWDITSYLNTEFVEEPESDRVAEILLSDGEFLNKAIPDMPRSKVLFFYMNTKIEELRKKTGLPMLLPPFPLQERLGNKIYLSILCEKLGLAQNANITYDIVPRNIDTVFARLAKELGLPFVAQGALGESGWDTSLVNSREGFIEALKKIKNGLRASVYLAHNIPVSVHVCILEHETIIRGPWLQLIGLPELSLSPFRFTGNDTNQSLLDPSSVNEILEMSDKIATFAKAEGYRGILGIDYLWDKETGNVYPQEINSRLVGLTRLLTGIQKDQAIFPDLLRHIEAYDTPKYQSVSKTLNRSRDIDLSKHDYSQVIVRNNTPHTIKILKRLDPGMYTLKNGNFQQSKQSLFVHDMDTDEILITYAAHAGSTLYSDEVIARLILKQSAVDNQKYALKPEALRLVGSLRAFATGACS